MPPGLRRLVLGSAALMGVLGSIAVAFSPFLLVESPLLLLALAPVGRHLVLGAAETPLVPLVAVWTVRRVFGLLVTYGVGALYGEAAVRWTEKRFPRLARPIRFFQRVARRGGAPLLIPLAGYSFAVLAGAARLRLLPVTIALTVGSLLWGIAGALFGEAISGWTDLLLAWLKEHMLLATAVCVAIVGVQQLVSRRRRGGAGPIPGAPPFADASARAGDGAEG